MGNSSPFFNESANGASLFIIQKKSIIKDKNQTHDLFACNRTLIDVSIETRPRFN